MEFSFNGQSSRNFNIKIKNSNHLSIPSKKLEFIEVEGRTDNLVIDNGCREMINIEIECLIDCRSSSTKEMSTRLDTWLNGHEGYKNLTFDDGTSLKAIFISQLDFKDILPNLSELVLQFKAYREGDL